MLFLIVILNEDDKSFLVELYSTHGDYLYSTAFRILKDQWQAEDAVQSSFIKIMDKIERIKNIPCHERLPYIVIIVKNQSINQYQQNKRRIALSLDEVDYQLADDAEDVAIKTVEMQLLMDYVHLLSDELRTSLLLRYGEDLRYRDIAELLNISEPLARKRVQRALEQLRAKMDKKG